MHSDMTSQSHYQMYFQTSRCIEADWVCDREPDCLDQSDEGFQSKCNYSCPANQTACKTGILQRYPYEGWCIWNSEVQKQLRLFLLLLGVVNFSGHFFQLKMAGWILTNLYTPSNIYNTKKYAHQKFSECLMRWKFLLIFHPTAYLIKLISLRDSTKVIN